MWLTIIVIGFIATLCYLQRKLSYWQARDVKVPPYYPIIGHAYGLLMKPHPWKYTQQCYNLMKDEPYWGMYEIGAPRLFLRDLDLIRDITIRDFDHFVDRRYMGFNKETSETDLMLSESLFHEKGEAWKKLRALLSPTFTSGKIKAMYPIIESKSEELIGHLRAVSKEERCLEIRHALGKYSLSVIAMSAFGMDLPIDKTHNEFDRVVEVLGRFDLTLILKFILLHNLPQLGTRLGIKLVPDDMKYFYDILEQTRNYRKENNVRREDFLDMLGDLLEQEHKSDDSKYRMTFRSLVAQSTLFIIAGYDTTANTIGFACYFLAKDPKIQDELREEINKIYDTDGELTYQNIMEATYLDAVLSESLRFYPQAYVVERLCTETYKVERTGLTIPKGQLICIPAYSLHHDEKYWENPDEFRPERFLPENKHKISQYAYCPFGYGQRNCIGMRFAQLEAKLAIAKIVHNFTITTGKDLILDSEAFLIKATTNGIYVNLEEIKTK